MLGNRKPSKHLFVHRFDHHSPVTRKVGGSWIRDTNDYNIMATDVPCFAQPATEEVKLDYKQQNTNVTDSIFLLDKSVWENIRVQDRIIVNGLFYHVKGYGNPSGLDRVFRLDVISEDF